MANSQNYSFHSTSAYVEAPRSRTVGLAASRPATTGSLSAISASNYQALNSEGGMCYSPAAASAPRRGREDMGDEPAIGDYGNHSPVGNTPWILFILLAAGYVMYIQRKKRIREN